jgi:hypothetical protein
MTLMGNLVSSLRVKSETKNVTPHTAFNPALMALVGNLVSSLAKINFYI